MEFVKLVGTVLALCFQPSCVFGGFGDHRICRRGTEKPCYKISSFQDSRLRASFDEARQKCRQDDGDLLSIETENEQRLVERFVLQLKASDGDFWIGLRRKAQFQKSFNAGCSSQYYWLDYSRGTFRNWMATEPSCGQDQCVALLYRPTKNNLFKWTDYSCNSKNNFICKYSDEKHPVPTPDGNFTSNTGLFEQTVVPKHPPITVNDDAIRTELSESSDEAINVYYILLATLPVTLLLILVVSGGLCFRVMLRRRKEQDEIYAVPGQWLHGADLIKHDHCNRLNQPGHPATHLEYMSSEIGQSLVLAPTNPPFEDYENISSSTRCGFVTNDIYEPCRSSSAAAAGWVDNDIYGY